VAPGLPRRLAPVLPTHLFSLLFTEEKSHNVKLWHVGFPRHACAHCEGFSTAAPRRAGTLFSVCLWGLRLSSPLRILGLVVLYTANSLIRRRAILRPRRISGTGFSKFCSLYGITLSFPRLSPSLG